MNTSNKLPTRSSVRTWGSVLAVAGALLTASAATTAHASESDAQHGVSDAELVSLGQRAVAVRSSAAIGMVALMSSALGRSAEQASEVRGSLAWAVTFGQGWDGLMTLDVSALNATADDEPSSPPPRFDYATNTNDPLAGL